MHRIVIRRAAVAALALIPLTAMMLPAQSSLAHGVFSHAHAPLRVGLVLDTGGRNGKSFNQLAYSGALAAQAKYGIQFSYVTTTAISDALYYQNLASFALQQDALIIGGGFLMQ